MTRAKIWCEVACGSCGALTCYSTYYKNASTISKLKEKTKDWVYDKDLGINLCPPCQKELRERGKQK